DVKPGWKAGTKIRFPNEGDEIPGVGAQEVVFIIEEKPHPVFKRQGDDLHMTMDLSLVEALAGFNRHIKTLDGRTLNVSSHNVIHPGQQVAYPNEGMPISKRAGHKGQLIIKYNVHFPRTLSPSQKEGLKKVLG